jgi:hypothetical protein
MSREFGGSIIVYGGQFYTSSAYTSGLCASRAVSAEGYS